MVPICACSPARELVPQPCPKRLRALCAFSVLSVLSFLSCFHFSLIHQQVPAHKVSISRSNPSTKTSPPSPTLPMAASSIPSIATTKPSSTTSNTTTSGCKTLAASAAGSSKARNLPAATSPSATSEILSASPLTATSSSPSCSPAPWSTTPAKQKTPSRLCSSTTAGKKFASPKATASFSTPPTRSSSPTTS